MIGMVCVREDLFNGLGSEKSADQQISLGRWDGESPVGLRSIAGMLHRSAERAASIWSVSYNQLHRPDKQERPSESRAAICGSGGA
jgi:hypothetical protein